MQVSTLEWSEKVHKSKNNWLEIGLKISTFNYSISNREKYQVCNQQD